jgi:DNA-binding MarR family transcriptional regulator
MRSLPGERNRRTLTDADNGFLSTNPAFSPRRKNAGDGILSARTGKTPRNDRRREECVLAFGAALNTLVSQSRALTAQAAATFHSELQPAAFHIALWLNALGPTKPSAVAQAIGMDRSAASRLAGELVRLGLIATSIDPSDRRSSVLSLTADGRRRMEAALRVKAFQQRVASWSEEDLALCTGLLRRLLDAPANAGVKRGRPFNTIALRDAV